jgi:hypothetical protein
MCVFAVVETESRHHRSFALTMRYGGDNRGQEAHRYELVKPSSADVAGEKHVSDCPKQ